MRHCGVSGIYGGVLALLLPELSTLNQPFEQLFYWIEHIQLVLVPVLLCCWGVYTMEDLSFMPYSLCAWGVNLIVALGLHQFLSVAIEGNFNLMGCSAGSVPEPIVFGVNGYQWVGLAGCTIGCLVLGRLYSTLLLKPFTRMADKSKHH